ncbi:aldehyde dehydrogenase family protein [Streptomyces sp. NPDC059153]|uniref:aldehyde dehydrogenase family protein n=1 Tax=Streptomyces sp. NPDC059153 TaxID=3346743 RepID=UPI0036790529
MGLGARKQNIQESPVYDDVDEAIEIINASEYGLSVSISTSNTYAAFELSDRIDSGAVH